MAKRLLYCTVVMKSRLTLKLIPLGYLLPTWHSLEMAVTYRHLRRPWVSVTARIGYPSIFCMVMQCSTRKVESSYRYVYLCWTAMVRRLPLLSFIALANIVLRLIQSFIRHFAGLATLLICPSFLFARFFWCGYTQVCYFFNFVSSGMVLRMANRSSRSITIQ